MFPGDLVDRFIHALERIETARDFEPMVSMFGDDSAAGNVLAPESFRGREGARRFWNDYRSSFGEIRSTFVDRIEMDGRAALEWTTEGTSPDGAPVRYSGVTLLRFAGDRIARFHAFFDPRSLGRQLERGADEG